MQSDGQTLFLLNRELAGLLKQACQEGKALRFTARGKSMAPVICEDDTETIAPLSWKSCLTVGDVVAVILPQTETLMIHRIVHKNQDCFLLKGDNLWQADGYFKKFQILGYVQNISKTYSGSRLRQLVERLFLFCSRYPKFIAFLSRRKIWTFFCRIANKIP